MSFYVAFSLQGHSEMFHSNGSLYGNFCIKFCLCCSSYVHFWKSAKNRVVWCLLYHSQQPLDRILLKHAEKETYFSHSGLQSVLHCGCTSGCINQILLAHQGVYSRATIESAFISCYSISYCSGSIIIYTSPSSPDKWPKRSYALVGYDDPYSRLLLGCDLWW